MCTGVVKRHESTSQAIHEYLFAMQFELTCSTTTVVGNCRCFLFHSVGSVIRYSSLYAGREGGREKRIVGGKGSSDRDQKEKELVCFCFYKENVCYHKLTHSQYAHITPTLL